MIKMSVYLMYLIKPNDLNTSKLWVIMKRKITLKDTRQFLVIVVPNLMLK